ncbi:EF-hand calcium-binding domain-containing protein 6-like, partial [Watersipora subatra]|uniref:EF-hand calcium-binding domain-containing protein 6-like n=1 Tax=Watersipora subatra TaxID=2589382 RepID=UPI00355C272A
MSRPASQVARALPPLPHIKHPLADVGGYTQIQGISTNGSRPPSNLFNRRYSPRNIRAEEANSCAHKKITDRQYTFRGAGQDCVDAEVLSPYVGDRGYRDIRSASTRRSIPLDPQMKDGPPSRCSTRADIRIEVDELEAIIRQKCRSNQIEVQKRFRDNDPKGNGTVTKEALLRIVVTLTSRPVSYLLFQRILIRFGLENQQQFNYADFIERSNTMPGNPASYPKWITSMNKAWGDKSHMTAPQVHAILKERAKQRTLDLFNLVPQSNPDGARRILKPEFRSALTQQLQVNMTDDEFEKLWQRYDSQNIAAIDSKILAQKLGNFSDGRATPKVSDDSNCLRRKEADRQRSLDTERWLKNKFRQGFHDLKSSFLQNPNARDGMIPARDFCGILENHGLKLDSNHLGEFLARCGIVQTKQGVPYMAFLKIFQDRSEEGMTHKILSDPKHRYNQYEAEDDNLSTLSALESQLINMFQKDFLSLLGVFHAIDEHRQGYIKQDQFRGAIENAFDLQLSDEQFHTLLDHVPLTKQGYIKYPE